MSMEEIINEILDNNPDISDEAIAAIVDELINGR